MVRLLAYQWSDLVSASTESFGIMTVVEKNIRRPDITSVVMSGRRLLALTSG